MTVKLLAVLYELQLLNLLLFSQKMLIAIPMSKTDIFCTFTGLDATANPADISCRDARSCQAHVSMSRSVKDRYTL